MLTHFFIFVNKQIEFVGLVGICTHLDWRQIGHVIMFQAPHLLDLLDIYWVIYSFPLTHTHCWGSMTKTFSKFKFRDNLKNGCLGPLVAELKLVNMTFRA